MTYLDSKLASRAQYDRLDASRSQHVILAEVLSDGQTERQGFATSREVTRNHVLSIVDRIKTVLLDREQILDTPGDQLLRRCCLNLREARKLAIPHDIILELLGAILLTCQTGISA